MGLVKGYRLMKDNVKILQMCSYYIGTKLFMEMFTKLGNAGIKQLIFVPISDNKHENANINNNMKNLKYIYSKNFNKLDVALYLTKIYKIFKDSINRINFDNIDLIHAHSLFINGGVARLIKKAKGIDYIVEIQNTDINTFFKYMVHLRKVGIMILEDASTLVFYSPSYRDNLINKIVPPKYRSDFLKKSVVIPSGINDFWIENIYTQRAIPKDNELKIIYVGTIDTNKNIDTTIEACKVLMNSGYIVKFKVVGKIANKKYELVIRQNSFIEYIGHSTKEELINYYRNADIFIMPSKFETFGLVYAEAMSQGLPIIYSKGQGFDGQFEEGEVGFSVRYNSAEQIVEKIKYILRDYKTISNNCIEKVNYFDWNKVTEEYIDVYKSIIG